MYRVFNMGVGMVLYLSATDAGAAIHALEDMYPEPPPVVIGEVTAWDGSEERVRL
jgi:phosphoribosylaminoimidazole (AIR) synthetase